MSGQQDHVVVYFMCRYYNGRGYPSVCKKKCELCYKNENYQSEEPRNPSVRTIYNNMNRIEMYIWIIETLKLLNKGTLEDCINEIKYNLDISNKIRMAEIGKIIKKYVTWEDIEEKLKTLDNSQNIV